MNAQPTFSAIHIPLEILNAFKTAGFSEHIYNGQEGVFIRKEMTCGDMPSVKENFVDGDFVLDETKCVIEICPNEMIQLYIPDIDHVERFEYKGHFDGWIALAKDAGVIV